MHVMDGIDEKGVVFLRDIKHSEKRGGFLHDIVDFVRFPDGVGVMQIVTSAHLFDLCRKKNESNKGCLRASSYKLCVVTYHIFELLLAWRFVGWIGCDVWILEDFLETGRESICDELVQRHVSELSNQFVVDGERSERR